MSPSAVQKQQPTMKTQIHPQTRKKHSRQKTFALWRWTAAIAVLASLSAVKVAAASLTLVNENFDSYSGAATSFSSTAVAIPNTDRIRVEDGLAQGDSPGGLGFNGVQLINWAPASAYNSGNAMLLRPNKTPPSVATLILGAVRTTCGNSRC